MQSYLVSGRVGQISHPPCLYILLFLAFIIINHVDASTKFQLSDFSLQLTIERKDTETDMIQSRHTDRNISFCQSYYKCKYRASGMLLMGESDDYSQSDNCSLYYFTCRSLNQHVTLRQQNCTLKVNFPKSLDTGELLYLETCHNNSFSYPLNKNSSVIQGMKALKVLPAHAFLICGILDLCFNTQFWNPSFCVTS